MSFDTFFPEALEVTQLGVETDHGTQVAATKRFFALMFDIDPKIPKQNVKQAGTKHPVGTVSGKGHTEGTAKGDASVEDLIYLFSTVHCVPTFDGNDAEFAPLSREVNAYKSLTFEKGQEGSGNADKFGFGVFTEYEIDFVPDKQVGLSAKVLGQVKETGATFSTNIETLANALLFPKEIDIFIAASEGTLPDNEVKPFSLKWKCSKTKGDVYRLTSSEDSYGGLVETLPDMSFEIVVPKGSGSNAYLDSIYTSDRYFIEIQARGGLADDDQPFALTIRAPFEFTNPGEGAAQDVHTATFTGLIVHDDTFNTDGGAVLITCHSNLSSL